MAEIKIFDVVIIGGSSSLLPIPIMKDSPNKFQSAAFKIRTCIILFAFLLTSCHTNSIDKVGVCCDITFTDVDSALNCLNNTVGEVGSSIDERLLLIAFVNKDVELHRKLGWNILKDPDIIQTAKRNYALVILDACQSSRLNKECSGEIEKNINDIKDTTLFVIANQELCWFGDWTLDFDKENIIERLKVGDGP